MRRTARAAEPRWFAALFEVAEAFGVSERTVREWLQRFLIAGKAGLVAGYWPYGEASGASTAVPAVTAMQAFAGPQENRSTVSAAVLTLSMTGGRRVVTLPDEVHAKPSSCHLRRRQELQYNG